jgi:hypothetical protein
MSQDWLNSGSTVIDNPKPLPDGSVVFNLPPSAADVAKEERERRRIELAERADARAETIANAPDKKLTPAQKAVDSKFATSYVEWAVDGGRSDYEKSRTQLDEVLTALDRGDDLTGPVTGRIPDAIRSFTNPESIAARNAVEEVVQRNLRLVLGAQFTEKEGERLIARAYNPTLSEAENAKRVRRLLTQIDQAAAAKDAAAAYYEENGTLAGWQGSLPKMAEFESAIDDPLLDADTPTGGNGLPTAPVTAEQSAAIFGEARFDAQGNPIGQGYTGETFLADGTPGPFMGSAEGVPPEVMAEADRLEAQLGETGLLELATQGMTLGLSDEAGGAGRAIGQALGGDFDIAQNYNFGVEVERELLRRARERTGGFGVAAELAGGGGAVRSVGNMALNAGRAAAARGAPVTRSAIQRQMVRQGATEGAMVGGAAGFGYGEGAEDTLVNTAAGAAGGAALGAIMQRIANKRANRGGGGGSGTTPAPTTPGGAVIQSADEFNRMTGANLQPLPADTGGAITRRASGAVAQTTFGAKPIVEAAQRANDEARAGISTLASRQGSVPASKQAAGEIAAKGADKVIKNTKTKVDVLYANARRAAQGVELELPMAQTVLQSHIDELSRVPGGGEGLSTLQTLAGDIAGKKFPVDGIKAMRTQLRDKFIKDGLRGSDLERRVNDVVDAAELDIEDGLIALNKTNAAKAYAEASKAAAERFTLIDDVLEPILGRSGDRSGEEVFSAIERLARGDAVTLGKFMKALPADEAGSIRGAIVDRLGRVSAGRQDAMGQAFSMNDFLTRWNDEGFSRGAKAALFDGETRAALDALARVAQGTKEGQRFVNFSNTGGANAFNFILNGAPFGAAVGGVLPAAVAGGTSVTAQFALGNLLANPKFARWLAKMPSQQTAAATKAHIKRLSNIAAADATIAADALGLQQQLNASFGPFRVAADQGTQGAGSDTKEPGKQ